MSPVQQRLGKGRARARARVRARARARVRVISRGHRGGVTREHLAQLEARHELLELLLRLVSIVSSVSVGVGVYGLLELLLRLRWGEGG